MPTWLTGFKREAIGTEMDREWIGRDKIKEALKDGSSKLDGFMVNFAEPKN